jgi:hypothetical protein
MQHVYRTRTLKHSHTCYMHAIRHINQDLAGRAGAALEAAPAVGGRNAYPGRGVCRSQENGMWYKPRHPSKMRVLGVVSMMVWYVRGALACALSLELWRDFQGEVEVHIKVIPKRHLCLCMYA